MPVKFLGVGEKADGPARLRRGRVRARAARAARCRATEQSREQRVYLDTPVTYLKGVGPARAEALRRLGIVTAGDLLFHIPHRYEDASTIAPIASLEPGMDGTIIGTVISKGVIPTRKGCESSRRCCKDETGMIEVSWPGQPFLDRTINKGDVLLLAGTRALLPRPPAPAARIRQPRRRGRRRDGEGACSRSIRRPKGCRSRSFAAIIDAHLDALLPLAQGVSAADDLLRRAGVPSLRRRAAHGAPPDVDRRGDARAGAARVRGAVLRPAFCSSAPRRWRARSATASASRTSASSRQRCKKRCRSRSPARRCARCARSSPTWRATDACSGCCRATSAAARRSSRCSPRCSRSRTAIRRRSWRRRSCSPSSTRGRSRRLLAPLGIEPDSGHGQPARRARERVPRRDWRAASRCSSSARTRSCRRPPCSPARLRRDRRAAPLRRRAAQGARREGRGARRAADDGDADSALARADAVRRSRSSACSTSGRPAGSRSRPRCAASRRASACCSSSTARSRRGARRTSSIR